MSWIFVPGFFAEDLGNREVEARIRGSSRELEIAETGEGHCAGLTSRSRCFCKQGLSRGPWHLVGRPKGREGEWVTCAAGCAYYPENSAHTRNGAERVRRDGPRVS
ncbi:hypothetical protein VTI74DRAFT_7746 [Chaetomium olivicolor]